MAPAKARSYSHPPQWRLRRGAILCVAALAIAPPAAAAAPDAIGRGGDPASHETFERGQAVAVEPAAGLVVFPIPISSPAIGTGLGLAAGLIYQIGQAGPSYTGLGVLGTSNGTWAVGGLQHFSLSADRYRITLGVGYASLRYDFFGAGAAAGDAGASIPVRQTGFFTNPVAEVRVADDLYLGLQYRLIDGETALDFSDRGSAIGDLLDGREGNFVSSGFGPVLDWDTRDDMFFPRFGHLLHADAVFASGEFLSDFNYRKAHLSFDAFHEIFDGGVLAARAAGCYADGEVPIVDLCLFGASNDLRGYEAGRYRDERMLAVQIEQRWRFAERWGLVAFAGIGGIGGRIDEIFRAEALASAGAGIRFRPTRSYNVSLAVDAAVSRDGDGGLYFRIGEAF